MEFAFQDLSNIRFINSPATSDMLDVSYDNNTLGQALKLPRGIALGMIEEISKAANAPKWENQMLASLSENRVESYVFEFYTMGDADIDSPQSPSRYCKAAPVIDVFVEKFHTYIESLVFERDDKNATLLLLEQHTVHQATISRQPNEHLNEETDFSARMDQITLQWSWGMKFLFQAFALREFKDKTWCLWPVAKPDFNNRQIELPIIWQDDPQFGTMMSTIFNKPETNFESQPVYSVPYQVDGVKAKGVPLTAMMEGVKGEGNESLEFQDLRAQKCTLKKMNFCFKAIMVRFFWCFLGQTLLPLSDPFMFACRVIIQMNWLAFQLTCQITSPSCYCLDSLERPLTNASMHWQEFLTGNTFMQC
jgi:hypothetical protein